jgi:glycosyltransferase involved in cell wall biosynthesis
MKIAFVYDAVYPWIKGGAEKRIYEIGKRLAKNGNDVHLFGVKWWDGADVISNDGMTLHGVCCPMELYVNGRRSFYEAVIYSISLLPQLAKENFDIIDVSVFPYFSCITVKFVSICKKIPVVTTWHEVWGDYWYDYIGKLGFIGKLVESMISRISNNSIAVSELTKKGLVTLGVNDTNIHLVANGIDLRRIAQIKPSTYNCDIIFIGRFIKEKNLDKLIEAVDLIRQKMPDVKCHVIGDGPEKKRLIAHVSDSDLDKNIRFFDFLEYDEVIAMLKSSKVLVLPSTREGFGIVVLEAFSCGVPVVTVNSARNAAIELVDDDTGFIVNADARELGESIYKLITDDTLRKKMSLSAISKAKEYDWDKITEQLLGIYDRSI